VLGLSNAKSHREVFPLAKSRALPSTLFVLSLVTAMFVSSSGRAEDVADGRSVMMLPPLRALALLTSDDDQPSAARVTRVRPLPSFPGSGASFRDVSSVRPQTSPRDASPTTLTAIPRTLFFPQPGVASTSSAAPPSVTAAQVNALFARVASVFSPSAGEGRIDFAPVVYGISGVGLRLQTAL
jgi:hypothetical protein